MTHVFHPAEPHAPPQMAAPDLARTGRVFAYQIDYSDADQIRRARHSSGEQFKASSDAEIKAIMRDDHSLRKPAEPPSALLHAGHPADSLIDLGPDIRILALAYPEFTISEPEPGRNGPAWTVTRKTPPSTACTPPSPPTSPNFATSSPATPTVNRRQRQRPGT